VQVAPAQQVEGALALIGPSRSHSVYLAAIAHDTEVKAVLRA
jgi:hypothetical protein